MYNEPNISFNQSASISGLVVQNSSLMMSTCNTRTEVHAFDFAFLMAFVVSIPTLGMVDSFVFKFTSEARSFWARSGAVET